MIAEPPFSAGGVKEMDACVLPAVAVPIVGAPGTVPAMVIEKFCAAVPAEFVAVKVPVNVPAVVGVPVKAPVAGLNDKPGGNVPDVRLKVGVGAPLVVTVYEYATLNVPLGGAALVNVGAAPGVTETAAEAALDPIALVAVTEQEYGVPLARPVTVSGLLPPLTLNGPGVHVAV